MWERIAENNRRIAAGQAGEFGRPIVQRLLQAEVPVHYLFNFSKDRMAEAVNLGVTMARQWCNDNGVPLTNPGPPVPRPTTRTKTSLQFTEQMKGFAAAGETRPQEGHTTGKKAGTKLDVKLTIRMQDVDDFITNPLHQGSIDGTITSPLLGGTRSVERGTFNLFVHETDPRMKRMKYRLLCRDSHGALVTMSGVKIVENDGSGLDALRDTTTLFVRVFEGEVSEAGETAATIRGAGVIHIEFFDFLQQMTTFRAEGPSVAAELQALGRFGGLFFGKLWDVYGPAGSRP